MCQIPDTYYRSYAIPATRSARIHISFIHAESVPPPPPLSPLPPPTTSHVSTRPAPYHYTHCHLRNKIMTLAKILVRAAITIIHIYHHHNQNPWDTKCSWEALLYYYIPIGNAVIDLPPISFNLRSFPLLCHFLNDYYPVPSSNSTDSLHYP